MAKMDQKSIGFARGAAFLQKPFTLDGLASKIRDVLDKQAGRSERLQQ